MAATQLELILMLATNHNFTFIGDNNLPARDHRQRTKKQNSTKCDVSTWRVNFENLRTENPQSIMTQR